MPRELNTLLEVAKHLQWVSEVQDELTIRHVQDHIDEAVAALQKNSGSVVCVREEIVSKHKKDDAEIVLDNGTKERGQ